MRPMGKKFLTKNIVIKTVNEADIKAKGLDYTEKIQRDSKKINDAAMNTYTKLKDLYKFDEGSEDALENPPKTTRKDDLDGYEIAAKGAGKMQGLRYDNDDTETFKQFMDRIDAINDDSEYNKDFGIHDGFGEGEKGNVYDELKEKGQEYKDYKYGDFDGIKDEYQKTPRVRTTKNESNMKRLNFKQEFKDEKHMMSLIKESYKVDNNTFLMADGNQTYKVRWEGNSKTGEAVSLLHKDENKINESKEMMKKLSNYKSSDVVGKTNNYINETVEFNKMMDIIREKKEK